MPKAVAYVLFKIIASMKIAVAGAGIAGLAIGWRLAEAGLSVEVIDRAMAGRGASWAAAGMIAPLSEMGDAGTPLAAFARASRALWPQFAADIERASGMGISFREEGTLILAQNRGRARDLQRRRDASLARAAQGSEPHGEAAEWLDAGALKAREPLLAGDILGALYIPGDAQADNRALGEALGVALVKAGGVLRQSCEILSVIEENNRVRGIVTNKGAIAADAIVMAMGAWLNAAGGALPRIAPVKGQMIAFEIPPGVRLFSPLVWAEDVYLVPRGNRLLAGATVEAAGFDTSVTREGREKLFHAATRAVPAARDWPIAECWAGLRPKSEDGMPVLGETRVSGLYVAGGQFRNGILFAPLIADALRRIVTGEDANDVAIFDPKRFA